MRAMFVVCSSGLLVGVVVPLRRARSANLRIANKLCPEGCSKHAATSVQKGHKDAATPVHAPKHTATKAAPKRPVVYSATRSFTLKTSLNRIRRGPRTKGARRRKHAMTL